MFKHLLIPTDGTKLSEAAVRAGVLLAREQGAKVTSLYVMPDYRAIIYGADALLTYNSAEFERSANSDADAALQFVDQIARPEGVPCNFVRVTHASVYQAIVKQAQELQCDLVIPPQFQRAEK